MQTFHEIAADLLANRLSDGVRKLQAAAVDAEPTPPLLSMLRLAIMQPGQSIIYYQRLLNLWQNWGRPGLKPNVIQRKVLLLADSTVDGLSPMITVFCAAWGIDVTVQTPAFDSIEQLALGQRVEGLRIDAETSVVLIPSEAWLARYLGDRALVPEERLANLQGLLESVLGGITAQKPRQLLISTFPERVYPLPGGMVSHGGLIGWNLARLKLNTWLAELQGPDLHVFDLSEAMFCAGGRQALGQRSYFRARIAYEQAGAVAAAREIANAYANVCGKSHRALVTDWDNTLWGGVVADDGALGVDVGLDTPDGLAYRQVQTFMRGLKSLGILLAGVSRNDPRVETIFEENSGNVLSLDDFSSVQVGFGAKSSSISNVSEDLGFGPEFMVFVDDSSFELVEVVQAHPYLDVIRAGPDPADTLDRLALSRFWSSVAVSDADLGRSKAVKNLAQQRELRGRFHDVAGFLLEIQIQLEVANLKEKNLSRVAQLFQKSNQFNLTTRRHSKDELLGMQDKGVLFGVVSYKDSFGSQGIISAIALESRGEELWIESWLMSCRVLNRTVEEAVFAWAVEQAGGRDLVGEYAPTAKNALVKQLYERCGMRLDQRDDTSGREVWRRPSNSPAPLPSHYAEVLDLRVEKTK